MALPEERNAGTETQALAIGTLSTSQHKYSNHLHHYHRLYNSQRDRERYLDSLDYQHCFRTQFLLFYLANMADRFPSLEDIDAGTENDAVAIETLAYTLLGDTNVRGESSGGDFLERERAALGDDADFFNTTDTPSQNQGAQVEDGDDDDLLGGGDFSAPAPTSGAQDDDLNGFESSFPAIDTRNDVCLNLPMPQNHTDHESRTSDQAVA